MQVMTKATTIAVAVTLGDEDKIVVTANFNVIGFPTDSLVPRPSLPTPPIGTSAWGDLKVGIERVHCVATSLGIATATIQISRPTEVAVLPAVGRLYGGKQFLLCDPPTSVALG
jgi:hypothetical protein